MFLRELSTVVKISCWFKLLTDGLKRFPVVGLSAVGAPCCANEYASCLLEVPYWPVGQFFKGINY
jgi:hypothetical protein